jgi:hypothetical protein
MPMMGLGPQMSYPNQQFGGFDQQQQFGNMNHQFN